MTFEYKLPPNADNQEISTHTTNNNSLIIIGANGSGKSKLGAWIERQDLDNVHRVGAQRSLTFHDFIPLKNEEQAYNELFYGYGDISAYPNMRNKYQRWQDGKFTTTLLNDYESTLASVIAKWHNHNAEYVADCKQKDRSGSRHGEAPETIVDKLKKIWHNVFPHRNLDIIDAKVVASINKPDGTTTSYKGTEMSDGERVGLYLIAQCLCAPKNKTIIIDEPEIHLHRSIMNRLWTELEKERADCLFIYITHDTQFAANHKQAKKIWVKSYDGVNWDWEEIQESTLPEQLLLDILGNRQKVLFVEGDANSYDTKLYREIYKDYYVVPCGGCSSVIARTKAMKNTPQLHDMECFGIIDRDFRSEHEINSLKADGIFTIGVAEVENLFLVEEILEVVNTLCAKGDKRSIENVKNFIISTKFANEINRQILEATVSELKHQISIVQIPKNDEDAARRELTGLQANVDFDAIKSGQQQKFNTILASNDYKQVLSIFNKKDVVSSVGHFFGLANNDYRDFIIRHLQGEKATEIATAITPYLPQEIPL